MIPFNGSRFDCVRKDIQRDQIGRFFKVIGNKFSYKRCPNIRQLLGEFGLLLIRASGHTGLTS